MPLVGTPSIRFTAKAGLVETAGELTSWTDQLSSEVLDDSPSRPKVGTTQLNGVNVVTFNEDEFIHTTTSTYQRDAGNSNETVVEAVIKISAGTSGSRYITDAVSAINRNAFISSSSAARFANAADKVPDWGDSSLVLPMDEWGVLRLVMNDSSGVNGRNHRVYWNGDLLFEAADGLIGSSSGSGIIWGAYSGGSNGTGIVFEVAEIVEYAAQAQQSDTDVITNRDYYESEWGLVLSDTPSGTVTLNGVAAPSAIVDVISIDNALSLTSPTVVDTVQADSNGDWSSTVAYDPTKDYFSLVRHGEGLSITGTVTSVSGAELTTDADMSALDTVNELAYIFKATGGTNSGAVHVFDTFIDAVNGIIELNLTDHGFDNTTTFEIQALYGIRQGRYLPRTSLT